MAERVEATVPVCVVEGHDEALPVLYRAIGRKKLPFSGTILVHFDAHPDLLCPNIPADEMSDKEKLFAFTEIADWILPAVYMDHINAMCWLKPPWASQMPVGSHDLRVGRDKITELLRVATPLSYFITELLYVHEDQLENSRSIPLHVVTLQPANSSQCEDGSLSSSHTRRADDIIPSKSSCVDVKGIKVDDAQTVAGGSNAERECSGVSASEVISRHPAWILDIDLDFFSTGNPFKPIFTEDQFDCLTRLYKLEEPAKPVCDASVAECVSKRECQLEQLQSMWTAKNTQQDLSAQDRSMVLEIRQMIGSYHEGLEIEAKDVHEYGIMTDLPVHHSSSHEITALVSAMVTWLAGLHCPPPSLITIARSTVDEYTPRGQVEQIQEQVLSALQGLYQNLDIDFLYLKPANS